MYAAMSLRLLVSPGSSLTESIGRAQATVVLSVRTIAEPPRTPDEPPGSNEKVAAILRRAGVPFALVPPATALAAITIEPAKILGVAHRVGSLELGKDADLILLDGDPLSWKSFVDLVVINGNVVYDRAKSDLLPKG